EETMAYAKKIGFDGIEYMLTLRDLLFGPSKVLKESEYLNMPVTSLHQPLVLLIQTPAWLFPRMLEISKRFPDVQLVNHHLSAFMFRKPSEKRALLYKQMFEKAGIPIAFESNAGGSIISRQYAKSTYDPFTFQTFAQQYNLPMNMDVCHIADTGYDVIKFFKDNHALIRLIHLSDFNNGQQHLPIGEGTLPIKELLKEIKRINWDGTITFEIYNFRNHKTKKDKLEAIKKSLTFVHENLRV
ncbi:MAG: sugar phosphate isomerase/epimerase, partial [Patescibacteria group bacterium]|nr:sugar phosphate isomerase/epimerase [Patescibacteria group bacterium]